MNTETPWLTLLEVTGEDRETFLQGQLTQDLSTLTPETPVRFAASCDPKGRVLALITLLRDGDGLYLALRADRAEDWLAHILRYRMRARVEIRPATSHRLLAHGEPPSWGPLEANTTRAASDAPLTWRIGGIAETLLSADAAPPAGALDDTAWRRARIAAGVADVGQAAAGEYTPHMLSLDRIGAISFSKGCYTGQEVVARTEHLGKVKRRARGISTASGGLAEGDALSVDGRGVGRVAVAAGGSGLAVLPDLGEDATLTLDDGRAVTLTV